MQYIFCGKWVNKCNSFIITDVYPLPAKDILHIQTNGSALFSFINQSGKTLISTTINGNGSINVSRFAAGIYYLKNSSNGEVQKVVITK